MIGVLANSCEQELVREFFELFKTPWEYYRPDRQYDVVLVAGEDEAARDVTAKLIVVYAGRETAFDREIKIGITPFRSTGVLSYRERRLPIYGETAALQGNGACVLRDESSEQIIGMVTQAESRRVARIGYDVFRELRTLLVDGQPVDYADCPTVEMHIALLRDLIVETGTPLVEIPPVPEGYVFIACLTHDVDHPSIRRHKWDHTAYGFLYRAIIGSTLNFLNRRTSARQLVCNWGAAAKLPLVYLGLAQDFWLAFDRYLKIDGHAASTFFVLPFQGRPGKTETGTAPGIRASGYGALDIADQLRTVMQGGGEIGLHGIDAWIDSTAGRGEQEEIAKITGRKAIGVRMHWLYFNENAPEQLERAGFRYDSTVGYNETIGYRSGVAQVYKPLKARHLLELPLHIMDTALFYPSYLNLSVRDADDRVGVLTNNAIRFGGVITFNWHDRSLAPERLWGEYYAKLIDRLKGSRAWCASAGQTVGWFEKRRLAGFQQVGRRLEILSEVPASEGGHDTPGLILRCYNLPSDTQKCAGRCVDFPLAGNMTIELDRSEIIGST